MTVPMEYDNKIAFSKGLRHGIPIALGYFAVAFTLGIVARKAGVTALQSLIVSATNSASAGEYVGFTLIGKNAAYLELAVMTLVANARYILLSCALSQKFSDKMSMIHRFLIGFFVTDEIFGISVAFPGKLNPFYTYGAVAVSIPAWSIGTYIGVVMGNILPQRAVSALGVGLYGMFLAIIIPPSKKNRLIASLVITAMLFSYISSRLPLLAAISDGTRIIIITVLISATAAILFPVKNENKEDV
ncbi:MAG: AzlC family ABC transporter permease [Lachnospiraceae bacterium]|nr:AzlC family ABC transporter permease [Lachnospiraceae bacterium]